MNATPEIPRSHWHDVLGCARYHKGWFYDDELQAVCKSFGYNIEMVLDDEFCYTVDLGGATTIRIRFHGSDRHQGHWTRLPDPHISSAEQSSVEDFQPAASSISPPTYVNPGPKFTASDPATEAMLTAIPRNRPLGPDTFSRPDFQTLMATSLCELHPDYTQIVADHPKRRGVDLIIAGPAGCGKTTRYIEYLRSMPRGRCIVVCISRNLRDDLQDRLDVAGVAVRVVTQHTALLNSAPFVIIDEVYALPRYLVERIAGTSRLCIGFGDVDQIRDVGLNVYPDTFDDPPDVWIQHSYTIPVDVLAFGMNRNLLSQHGYTTSGSDLPSLFKFNNEFEDLLEDALTITFTHDDTHSGETVQTVQGERHHITIVHMCKKGRRFLDTSFLWTAITRADVATFLDFDDHCWGFLFPFSPPTPTRHQVLALIAQKGL